MRPATVDVPAVELTIALPRPLFDELVAYAELRGGDVGWSLRRGARYMLDGEHEQDQRLRALSAGERQRSTASTDRPTPARPKGRMQGAGSNRSAGRDQDRPLRRARSVHPQQAP